MTLEEASETASGGGRALPEEALPPAHDPESVGRYEITGRLGQGGMGVVYAAVDPQLRRPVALKLVRSERRDDDVALRRIAEEARTMAKISHPNVIEIFDVGRTADGVYIAMERIDGQSLGAWTRNQTWRDIVDAYVGAAEGLAAAHDVGVVHRDFKPHNVMVASDGRVLVLDFGLARSRGSRLPSQAQHSEAFHAAAGDLTADGEVAGTPVYMAPEQIAGRDIDGRADQFSFCVALYESLAGRRPFSGRTLLELADSITTSRIPPLPPRRVPRRLESIVRRGLDKDPGRRHEDMRTLAARLQDVRMRSSRRRAGAVWGVAGAVAVAGFAATREDEPSCDADGRLAPVWNPERRGALIEHLERVGGAAPQRVVDALDRYAENWRASYTEACAGRATAAQELDLTMHCLQQRLGTFTEAVGVLESVDRSGAAQALRLTEGLPDAQDCEADDPAAIAARPRDRWQADAMVEVARLISKADDLREVGQFPSALAAATAAVKRADEVGVERQRARARLSRGQTLRALRDHPAARADLEEAFVQAMSANDDALAANVSTSLILVVGADLSEFEAVERWISQSEVLVGRLSDASAHERRFHNSVGAVRARQGRYEEAYQRHQTALEVSDRDADPHGYAVTLGYLGQVLTSLGSYTEAEETLRDAIAAYELALGPQHPDVAVEYNELGTVLERLDRLEDSLAAYTEAVRRFEPAVGLDSPVTASAMGNRASVLASLLRFDEAREVLERAHQIKLRTHGPRHRETLTTAVQLGALSYEEGNFEDARRRLTDAARSIERELGPQHPDLATAYTALGATNSRLHREEDALDAFGKALEIRRKTLPANHPYIAETHYNLGLVHYNLEDFGSARVELETSVELTKGRPNHTVAELAAKQSSLARVYGKQGRHEDAVRLLREILPGLDAAGEDNPWFARQAADTRLALARSLRELGERKDARAMAVVARDYYQRDPKRSGNALAQAEDVITSLGR